jgi:PAS domain S-box-containing protein
LDAIALRDPQLAALIVDNAIEYAIFTLTLDGTITGWSRGAENILGYRADEAVGMNFAALFIEPDILAEVPAKEIQKAADFGRAEDTRWHHRRDGERFWANGVTMALAGSDPKILLKIMRDETPAKRAEDQRVLLLNELNHRIKNTLTTVQSIAEHSLRAKGVDPAIRADFIQRLMALSEAHNVLVSQNWAFADLRQIVEKTFAPHDQSAHQIDGPDVRLSPQQAVAMSLALHELVTNALKYGALSVPDGRVKVSWNLSYDDQGRRGITFLWEEIGGPQVHEPTSKGFGSQLLLRVFGPETGGAARLDFAPTGVRCIAEIPLPDNGESTLQIEQGRLPAIDS